MRPEGDPRDAMAAVRLAAGRLDPGLARSLERMLSQVYAGFAVALAVLAVTLAGIGIYGVMAYLVSRRVKEIGVRMALGAGSRQVLVSVILQGLRPVMIGCCLGLLGAAGLSAVLHATLAFPGSSDLLYGLRWWDPATFGGLTLLLGAIAALASLVPARRALRVEPVVALRCD